VADQALRHLPEGNSRTATKRNKASVCDHFRLLAKLM